MKPTLPIQAIEQNSRVCVISINAMLILNERYVILRYVHFLPNTQLTHLS